MKRRYRPFYEVVKELMKEGKKFDAESLKLISLRDLNMAGLENAEEAACSFKLIENEIKRRVDIISKLSFEEVESDNGRWEVLDDMSMYYTYYYVKSSPINKKDAPKWRLLVDEMKKLRGSYSGGRNNQHLARIYALLPEVKAEGIVPIEWCNAVEMNADQFDGKLNDGNIMRDGALRLTEEIAKKFGYINTEVSGNIAKMIGAEPVIRDGGYIGSYKELFTKILTPEQKVIYMSKLIE